MYKGIAIIAVRECERTVKIIALESSRHPKKDEETMQKEWALERGILKVLEIEEEQMLWARVLTKLAIERRGLRLTIVEDENTNEILATLSEGPTKPKEKYLWELMTREQRMKWTEEQYMTLGKVTDVIETRELLKMMETIEMRGIISMKTEVDGKLTNYY